MTPPSYTFKVPFPPKTKQRPRMGRGRRVFTPQPTIDFEDAVLAHWQSLGKPQTEKPVKVLIRLKKNHFIVTITELDDRDQKALVRGDVDNYAKAILDGLQKGPNGAFKDDRQVWELVVSKHGRKQ